MNNVLKKAAVAAALVTGLAGSAFAQTAPGGGRVGGGTGGDGSSCTNCGTTPPPGGTTPGHGGGTGIGVGIGAGGAGGQGGGGGQGGAGGNSTSGASANGGDVNIRQIAAPGMALSHATCSNSFSVSGGVLTFALGVSKAQPDQVCHMIEVVKAGAANANCGAAILAMTQAAKGLASWNADGKVNLELTEGDLTKMYGMVTKLCPAPAVQPAPIITVNPAPVTVNSAPVTVQFAPPPPPPRLKLDRN